MHVIKPLLALSHNLVFIFIGILGIGFIIGFHELGHFLFGKLFQIKTPSFSIGFGPKIYKKKIGDTNFSIGAIPLGGYVESDAKSFESKPYYQKMIVLGGGIAFNLLFAHIVFCALFSLGLPNTRYIYPINTVPIIKSVDKSDEVQQLGLNPGDQILAIESQKIKKETTPLFFKLRELSEKTKKKVDLQIKRGEKIQNVTIDTEKLKNALAQMKITFIFSDKKGTGIIDSITKGIKLTNAHIMATLALFKNMAIKRDTSAVGGPILIISETVKGAGQGLKTFLLLLAIISVSLAILNLIPLPILDGGQALLYTIEALIRTKLSDKTKEAIFIASWILMLFLFVLISARDIWRIVLSFIKK